jgi:hypothetical protein
VTIVNPGAVSNNTTNVAHKLLVAWVDSSGTALVGPQGQNIPLAQGGVALSAGANSQSSGTINFSNANGVTFGMDGAGNITATVTPGAAAGIAAANAGTQTATSGTLVFANSNNISFGMSNSSVITASYSQSNQTVASGNIAGTGLTTTTTAGSILVGTNSTNGLSLGVPNWLTVAAGGFTGGVSTGGNTVGNTGTQTGSLIFAGGNNITLSVGTAAGGNQTITVSGANFPAAQIGISSIADSANTQTVGMLSFANSNGISFGLSTGAQTATLTASYTVPTVPVLSIGVSTGGATAGNTGTYSGQVVFAGGNNITLSVGTAAGGAQTITISGANAGGAQTGISGIIVSNTTYTSGTVSFSNANGISFGSSAGQAITASYTVPTQTNQTVGIYASSQTTGSASSFTYDARSLSFIGAGIVSVGNNSTAAGTTTGIIISATQSNQAMSAQGGSSAFQTLIFTNSNNVSFSNTGGSVWGSYALNVSANGGTSNALSGLTFANSQGVTFGLSTGAGIGTITASVSQSNQTVGLYALGNTTQNSSTTLDARTLSFNALGAATWGYSNGSIQVSVPATSSLVGTSGLSVSTNASTISVYPAAFSTYVPQWPGSTSSLLLNALGVSSANPVFFPFKVDWPIVVNMVAILQSYSYVTSSSAASLTQRVQFGLFSNNASTWSLISSGVSSLAMTNSGVSGTVSYATATSTSGYGYSTAGFSSTATGESLFGTFGFRNPAMQFGGNLSITPGWYAIGMLSTASSSSANVGINQALIGNVVPVSSMFGMGQSTTVTNQMLGMGYGTATTASLPGNIAFSNMTNSLGIIPIITLMNT